MSKEARAWFKRQNIADRTLRAVLAALVSIEKDGVCRIPHARLAAKVDVAERTVGRSLIAMEALGIIHRTKDREWGKKGRSTDLICLSLDLDFDLSKEDKMSSAPTTCHTRTSIYGPSGVEIHRCVGRVWRDSSRGDWRAILTLDGINLDLGRHEAKDLAEAEIRVAIADIEHAASNPSGTPRNPVVDPSLKSLTGTALCDFLFGSDQDMRRPSGRAADRPGFGGSSPNGGRGGEAPASMSRSSSARASGGTV
ncbi:hypothetical protein [Mesorhizobium sp.]|uniref:hypothetical protein n=1 Tax=Mesorhizobium sp. TaxID=1871066 RepID=UPI000FE5313D|nr:hypothetical protein [Mesorhizobium sp.]RWO51025.1 MAG: hypothetical protein EOS13_21705 [Mesorhizobium sp.]